MARPFITMTNTKTKHQTPIFQSREDFVNQKRTTIKVDKETSKRIVNANREDILIDKTNGLYKIILRNPGVRLISVYKAVSKIILGLMPLNLLDENIDFFDWILDKKELNLIGHAFQTKLYTKYFEKPSAMLYQAKQLIIDDKEYPEFIGVICFANTVIQFYLPISKRLLNIHNDNNGLELTIYPAFAFDDIYADKGTINISHFNFEQTEVYKHNETFTFKPRT